MTNFKIATLLFALIALIASSCDSEDVIPLTTETVSKISSASAFSGGVITDNGGSSIALRGVCWSTQPNPTTADYNTKDGKGIGTFTSQMTGLEPDTKYYVRAYYINNEKTSYGQEETFKSSVIEKGVFLDARDSVSYNWVKIGDQVWMAENLKVSLTVVDTTGGYADSVCQLDDVFVWGYADNDTDGKFYSWLAALKACPAGWHLPSDEEWTTLADFLLEDGIASGKEDIALKAEISGGNDTYGFAAIPSGVCASDGTVYQQDNYTWWRSSSGKGYGFWQYGLYLEQEQFGNSAGLSVRCIRD